MKSNAARDKRYELELRKKPCELEAKKHGDFIPVMVRVFKDSISRMQSFRVVYDLIKPGFINLSLV